MAKLSKDAVIRELERTQCEYKQVHASTVSAYEQLDLEKDQALITIENVEELANSVSDYPILFKKKIAGQLKDIQNEITIYNDKEKIVREKRNKDIAAGAATVATLGVGTVLITSFRDFWNSKLKLDNKWSKNITVWIIILIFSVVCFAIYRIAKLINNTQAAKKAAQNAKKILREIESLKEKTAKANELHSKISDTRSHINGVLTVLSSFSGIKYYEIPEKQREELKALINTTLGLAKLANTRIE